MKPQEKDKNLIEAECNHIESLKHEIRAVTSFMKRQVDFKTAPVDKLIDVVLCRFSNEVLLQAITVLYRLGVRSPEQVAKLIPDSKIDDYVFLKELTRKATWMTSARDIIGRMKQLGILTKDEMIEGFALIQEFISDVKSMVDAQRFATHYIFQVKGNRAKIEGTLTCLDSGISYGEGVQLVKVPWRILPSGEHPYPAIVEHFESLAKGYKDLRLEKERIDMIFDLEPILVIIGEDNFERSAIFLFKDSDKAVLECPYYGNATYIIEGDWMSLSKLTKKELIKDYPREARRKYHSDDWFIWLKKSLGKI